MLTRRKAIAAVGKYLVGCHAASVIAPVVGFFLEAPTWNMNAAASGFICGNMQAVAELLGPRSKEMGWPYLHVLCHCFAVASMRANGVPDSEAIRWSEWGGTKDELLQQYWAQLYRREVHPKIIEQCEDDKERSTVMAYLWGTENEQRGAKRKCQLQKGRSAWSSLCNLRVNLTPLRDACESAWQRSDELDNELGRKGGLECPNNLVHQERLQWCYDWVREQGIEPTTPEGPGTDRPFGPFHPRYAAEGWETFPELQQVPHPIRMN